MLYIRHQLFFCGRNTIWVCSYCTHIILIASTTLFWNGTHEHGKTSSTPVKERQHEPATDRNTSPILQKCPSPEKKKTQKNKQTNKQTKKSNKQTNKQTNPDVTTPETSSTASTFADAATSPFKLPPKTPTPNKSAKLRPKGDVVLPLIGEDVEYRRHITKLLLNESDDKTLCCKTKSHPLVFKRWFPKTAQQWTENIFKAQARKAASGCWDEELSHLQYTRLCTSHQTRIKLEQVAYRKHRTTLKYLAVRVQSEHKRENSRTAFCVGRSILYTSLWKHRRSASGLWWQWRFAQICMFLFRSVLEWRCHTWRWNLHQSRRGSRGVGGGGGSFKVMLQVGNVKFLNSNWTHSFWSLSMPKIHTKIWKESHCYTRKSRTTSVQWHGKENG